jgi:hypothetical protein
MMKKSCWQLGKKMILTGGCWLLLVLAAGGRVCQAMSWNSLDFTNSSYPFDLNEYFQAEQKGAGQAELNRGGLHVTTKNTGDQMILRPKDNFDWVDSLTLRIDFTFDTVNFNEFEFLFEYRDGANYQAYVLRRDGSGFYRKVKFGVVDDAPAQPSFGRETHNSDLIIEAGRIYTLQYTRLASYVSVLIWSEGKNSYYSGDWFDDMYVQKAAGPVLGMRWREGEPAGMGITYKSWETLWPGHSEVMGPRLHFMQIDQRWSEEELGNAAAFGKEGMTIGSHGCALTSAAMVFRYYGFEQLPDGSELNPSTLNQWLKNQSDGYVQGTLLNWAALTRLSTKLAAQYGTSTNRLEALRTAAEKKEASDGVGPLWGYYNRVYDWLAKKGVASIYNFGDHFMTVAAVVNDYSRVSVLDPLKTYLTEVNEASSGNYNTRDVQSLRLFIPLSGDSSQRLMVVDHTRPVKVFLQQRQSGQVLTGVTTSEKQRYRVQAGLQTMSMMVATASEEVEEELYQTAFEMPPAGEYFLKVEGEAGVKLNVRTYGDKAEVATAFDNAWGQEYQLTGEEPLEMRVNFVPETQTGEANQSQFSFVDPIREMERLLLETVNEQTPQFVIREWERVVAEWRVDWEGASWEAGDWYRYWQLIDSYLEYYEGEGWVEREARHHYRERLQMMMEALEES